MTHRIVIIEQKKDNASSKYFGVSFIKREKKYRACISKDKKSYHLGSFTDEIESARTYNIKAVELYGKYANLNII